LHELILWGDLKKSMYCGPHARRPQGVVLPLFGPFLLICHAGALVAAQKNAAPVRRGD
jgi:hypothetical protein